MPPSARRSTHAYAYAGTNAGATVGTDVSVNGNIDNSIDDSTDGRCDVRIGSTSFRASVYGVSVHGNQDASTRACIHRVAALPADS